MSSEETEERESPSFNGGPRAGPALTILCRGADIGEEDKIPAGLKNGTPPPHPPSWSLDGTSVPLVSSHECVKVFTMIRPTPLFGGCGGGPGFMSIYIRRSTVCWTALI